MSKAEAIKCCGEMGFLQFLAKQHHVKVTTWEGDSLSEANYVLTGVVGSIRPRQLVLPTRKVRCLICSDNLVFLQQNIT
jgi:hypothetical protein